MRKKTASNIHDFRPKPGELEKTIRMLAGREVSPAFGDHALDRMEERGITNLDVLRILRSGMIWGGIEPGKAVGEWKCKVVAKLRGNRDAGVVAVVINRAKLFVKTVEWEDL